MKVCLMIVVLFACGVSYGGELAPAQKTAAQKSPVQKVEAVQKSAVQKDEAKRVVRLGLFGRRAARRSCRDGSCG